MIHEGLSREVIGSAMAVLNELGPGLDEKLYERALLLELRKRGKAVDQQKGYPVYYSGEHIGTLVHDLVVENTVVGDPKVVETFNDTHVRQMLGYLAITKLHLALLVNFKHAKLQWKRVVRETSPSSV